MHNFRNLQVWKDAIALAVEVYKVTSTFPGEEKFNLINQINRSAASVPSNIAEGAGRNTSAEFNHFLRIATGSAYEMETQLILANQLGFVNEMQLAKIMDKLHSVQKMTYALKSSLFK